MSVSGGVVVWIGPASLLSPSFYMLEFLEAGSLEPCKPVQFPTVVVQFLFKLVLASTWDLLALAELQSILATVKGS